MRASDRGVVGLGHFAVRVGSIGGAVGQPSGQIRGVGCRVIDVLRTRHVNGKFKWVRSAGLHK